MTLMLVNYSRGCAKSQIASLRKYTGASTEYLHPNRVRIRKKVKPFYCFLHQQCHTSNL